MEGGHKKKGAKDGDGTTEGGGANVGANAVAPTNAKGHKMKREPMTCLKCGEQDHRQASSKCRLNGIEKRGKY
jgi:hypothetical protein